MKRLLAIGLLLVVAACGGKPTYVTRTDFNPEAARFIFTQGDGEISGRAFIKTPTGVRSAAGSKVTLVPATSYAEERVQLIYGSNNVATKGVKFRKADKRYYAYTRSTMADAKGNFVFRNVGPGSYFVTTSVLWKTASTASGKAGGALIQKINVGPAEKKKIVLSAAWK